MTASASIPAREISYEIPLTTGWELVSTAQPATPATVAGLQFIPAQVPGTVASALRAQKAWRMGDRVRFDTAEHWFRCRFGGVPAEAGEEVILRLGGIATISEVWLNGEQILKSDSMFAAHEVDVSALIRDCNELMIVCRSLSRALLERRGGKPRARWRTRIVTDLQLRWFRTTMLGRCPGFSPEPEPVGPWRPVTLVRRSQIVVENWTRQVSLDGCTGIIRVDFRLRDLDTGAGCVSGSLLAGEVCTAVGWYKSEGRHCGCAEVRIPNVIHWWPHTHGRPNLYPVCLELQLNDGSTVALNDDPVGFRSIDTGATCVGESGLSLKINGTPIFCRGAVWTPPDVVTLAASAEVIRQRLQLLCDAGFNLIRLAGTTIYEGEIFHRLCDELGLLVWQDMMFANMDYPCSDADFCHAVCTEAETELSRLARHPSSAIICGNSEIEQQVAMLGMDPALGRGLFFGEELPRLAAKCCPGVPYIPSAPFGEDMPFRTRTGVSNYFGVGAYMRPIDDVRRSEVQFASECLAFANVPEPGMMDKLALATPGGTSPTHPSWKRSIPRDSGAGWDFEDVRDHYLTLLYSVDPVAVRCTDIDRYWELSRMASGEVMAEVFNEWRRPASPCRGGIILWSADLEPGAGWGILDSEGWPKAAYWFLKRTLAPCTVWTTDEGLNGIDIHVVNDRPAPVDLWLHIALYQAGAHVVQESDVAIAIPGHGALTFGLEQILGRFVDASCAYRFGPPGHDLIVASLHESRGDVPFAQSFRFPAGHAIRRTQISDVGLTGQANVLADGNIEVLLTSRRFAWGVRVAVPGFLPDDAYFGIEPCGRRRIVLRRVQSDDIPANLAVTAVNAEGPCVIAIQRFA
jgi:beta-mannosidase